MHILIVGAGPTALTAALALHTYLPAPKPEITLFELRDSPATIGGAVNLTPKALRYLNDLGVYDHLLNWHVSAQCKTIEMYDVHAGQKYAEVDFRGSSGEGIGKEGEVKFYARRVLRSELQGAMLREIELRKELQVLFGKKVVGIREERDEVLVELDNGVTVFGDCVLGCDGIHSAIRSLLVDPDRKPTYTGISVAMAIASLDAGIEPPPWTTTAVVSSRRGSLMCSYFKPDRKEHYIGAVMEVADVGSREGWKARGEDQEAIKEDLLNRFKTEVMPANEAIIRAADEWTLYPVFALPAGGKWISPGGRGLLLGDAAHAVSSIHRITCSNADEGKMPPQGESTGICIEDAVALSRAMIQHDTKPVASIFRAYENFRRPHTDRVVKEAIWRFETVKDKGWLMYQLIVRSTSWFLWWTAEKRKKELSEDFSEMEFEIPD